MNARLYDPVIGRFFSPHLVIQDYEATQSLNRYSYCRNNPVNRVDIDGRLDEWVETEGEMKYDSRVIDQKTAIEFYGKDAIYRPVGYTYYDANDKQVILQDNEKWSYTSQVRPDPECPTCGDNNSNTIDWKLFQKGFNTYKPLLKAAEISLDVSANLLFGTVGLEGLFVTKSITTSEGFLFGGFAIKTPFNIPVQRFGNLSIGRPDFWGTRIGTSQFANRTFGAIKPAWNSLTEYTSGIIPKGTPVKFGIIGPQGWRYPGGSFQFIVKSSKVINQSSKLLIQ